MKFGQLADEFPIVRGAALICNETHQYKLRLITSFFPAKARNKYSNNPVKLSFNLVKVERRWQILKYPFANNKIDEIIKYKVTWQLIK